MSRPLVPSPVSYLYVIGHDTGPQKIGFSQHPPSRARLLKVAGQPHYKAHWWAELPADQIHGAEAFAHWLLRDRALGREWFDITPQEGADLIEHAAKRYISGERIPETEKEKRMTMSLLLSVRTIDRIDDWRVSQRPIPSFSDAIRQLVSEQLDRELEADHG